VPSSEIDELDPWLTPVGADCKIDLLLVVGAAGIGSASTVTVALLILTLACGDPSEPSFLVVLLTLVGCWPALVGEASGVTWLVFSNVMPDHMGL
jgi:hypothetical protein